jgi:hypothetical protein
VATAVLGGADGGKSIEHTSGSKLSDIIVVPEPCDGKRPDFRLLDHQAIVLHEWVHP